MLKSYVKRFGHFTDAQKNAYETLAQGYIIPFSENYIDLPENTTVEIGFGSGIATAEIAQENPGKNYIGIEIHRPGIGRLLMEIEKRPLKNIKIIEYDAAIVMEKMIPPCSLDAIHIFFPDPWPKKKHKKRRLVQRPFTQKLAACLKPKGYLYMVTDWEDYARHAMEELSITETLVNAYDDFASGLNWRPKTKFEQKGLAKDHVIRELMFFKS